MAKIIYKIVLLILIFFGALIFFISQMNSDVSYNGKSEPMGENTFPCIELEVQGEIINALFAYSAPIKAQIVRESMTVLNDDKSIKIKIGDGKDRLTALKYQVLDKESNDVYTSGAIPSISENQKEVEIVIDYSLKTSTEYILDLEGTTKSGREVHYYTRLKYYLDNSHLSDKLNFIRKFHKNTFVKSKAQALEPYLESKGVNKNNTLSRVDIKSGSDFVTWGNLSPTVVSDEWMTVTEYNMETACVKYNYFVKAKTNSGEEIFQIKEFYRVRYAGGHNYLLNFERNMEAQFDVKNAAVKSNQLKLGITEEHENKILVNDNLVYFVRQGSLYSYDLKANKVTCIYSMSDPEAGYKKKIYNEHDIRILKLDQEGNIYFCAFGYFSRGEYEGDVAIVLYEYKKDGELDELVYMPAETTYQRLKEDFETYGYVSSRGVYYFTVADRVYSYNITGRRLEILANNVHENSFMTLENVNCYAWSSNYNTGYGESVTIYNLETDEKQILYRPDDKTYIRLLGVIDDNVVYGYVRKEDIGRNNQGIKIVPCYAMYIADTSGKVKKEFKKTGEYIQNIKSNGNVINITLCKKDSSGKFIAGDTDSISNLGSSESTKIRYTSRVTNKCLTEWYIQFPSTFEMPDIPAYESGPSNLMTTERFVRLEQSDVNRYYVSALGRIVSSYSSVRKAIKEADKVMGVVITNKHRILWERGGSFLQNSIAGIEGVAEDQKVTNYAACAYMLLKNAGYTPESKTIFGDESSIYEMLHKYIENPVSLSGCSLEQVLYFVSNNKPVIASISSNKAVLIGGYTSSKLTIYDPATGKARDVSRKKYEKIFKEAGNNFISYMK